MKGFFITGIGTDVGKTVVSAIVTEALKADYWKPVQCGNLDYTDAEFIREHTLNCPQIHPEAYAFPDPVSPHLAARLADKNIELEHIKLNRLHNTLVVEGAGGAMVPLSDKALMTDLIRQLQLPVIVVSMHYLGSINHTLLTLQCLDQLRIPVAGIIFNGEANPETERFILQYTGKRALGSIPKAELMSKGFVIQQAEKISSVLQSLLSGQPEEAKDNNLPIDYESF